MARKTISIEEYYIIMTGGKATRETLWHTPRYKDSNGNPITGKARKKALNTLTNWAKNSVLNDLTEEVKLSHSFEISIPGASLSIGNFSKVTGLEKEIGLEAYHEGGSNGTEHYFPTFANQSRIVLERALTFPDPMDSWFKEVETGACYKTLMTVTLLKKMIPIARWSVSDTMPIKMSGPDFDAMSSAPAIMRYELVHGGVERLF